MSSNNKNNIGMKAQTDPFVKFLMDHKVEKTDPCTHTAFGPPWGKFFIPEEENEEFMDLYIEKLEKGIRSKQPVELHIIERPTEIGPLVIDIDFDYNKKELERVYTGDDANNDIKLNINMINKNRIYSLSDVKYIIAIVNQIVRKYYTWGPETLFAFCFEKNCPTKRDNLSYKDGFHITYPYLALSESMRFLVLHELKQIVIEGGGLKHIPYTNDIKDVFDMSIVQRNGWVMYGSKKFEGHQYYLTHVYECSLAEISVKKFETNDLVRLLSNRRTLDTPEQTFNNSFDPDELADKLEEVTDIYDSNKKKQRPKKAYIANPDADTDDDVVDNDIDNVAEVYNDDTNGAEFDDNGEYIDNDNGNNGNDNNVQRGAKPNAQMNAKNNDPTINQMRSNLIQNMNEKHVARMKQAKATEIKMAGELVKIMTKERATSYDTWIKVGWALHGVDPTLLTVYKQFSKKAGAEKYNPKACEKVWAECIDKGLSIGSLKHWAKIDNPIKYSQILSESINDLLQEAESGTEFDVAKVVYQLYKDSYKCTSIKHQTWYEFQGHRWVEVESAYTLNTKISEELSKEFATVSSVYMQQMAMNRGQESDIYLKKSNNVMHIINKLKKCAFKENIIKECARMFYDKGFEEKLDSNRNLVGFNNGVYDLEENVFRAGAPEDLVSLSVGFDWTEFSPTHEHVLGIKEYFTQVQREEEMREYILTLLASYLDGHTKREQFILWTGSGCLLAGTGVMMHDNTVKLAEDIVTGDKLMGNDYTPRTVKHLYRGKDKMFRVTHSNNKGYTVNGDHRMSLVFTGQITKTFIPNLNIYVIVWYEFDPEVGIAKKAKYFENDNNDNMNDIDNYINVHVDVDNIVPENHSVIITVNKYLTLDTEIKQLLKGQEVYGKPNQNNHSDQNHMNKIEKSLFDIDIKYESKSDYYGFELDGNQQYLLANNIQTANSNGKSKTVELFQMAFGDYCGVLPVTLLTQKRTSSGQATPELALMRGKRFVVFQEPENKDQIQVGLMKELTGGDWIYARPLFKDPMKYKPQFKLLLTCNKLPFIPSTDGGTWRRLRVSPWESEFVDVPTLPHQFKKDFELLEKLELWKKAFLWYLIKVYYPIYKKNGLKEPAKVTLFTNKYKKQSDIFFEYIDITLEITKNPKDAESFEILYGSFKYWYGESYAVKNPFAKKDLMEYMQNNNYNCDKKYVYGVKFKGDENPGGNGIDDE